jgi:hypothetical protein
MYPRLDSLIWSSTQSVGAQTRVLAFDPENGLEAFVDRGGVPGWVDLRVGTVKQSRTSKLAVMASMDAWSIFGVTGDTLIRRSTPSGEWEFAMSRPVRGLFPLPDGGLIALTSDDASSTLTRLRPPERTIIDSAVVPTPSHSVVSRETGCTWPSVANWPLLNASTFEETVRVRFDAPVIALTTTPSGDRVFVATEGSREIAILDRYSGERTEAVRLPRAAKELRIDPLGRLLLARPDTGDSVWVIDVGTESRRDYAAYGMAARPPNVGPDGAVVTIARRTCISRSRGTTSLDDRSRWRERDLALRLLEWLPSSRTRPGPPGGFPVDTLCYAEPIDSLATPVPTPVESLATRPQVVPADTSRCLPQPAYGACRCWRSFRKTALVKSRAQSASTAPSHA